MSRSSISSAAAAPTGIGTGRSSAEPRWPPRAPAPSPKRRAPRRRRRLGDPHDRGRRVARHARRAFFFAGGALPFEAVAPFGRGAAFVAFFEAGASPARQRAAATASACPLTFTPLQTRATVPSGPIRSVERIVPSIGFPYIIFFPRPRTPRAASRGRSAGGTRA